MSDQSESPPLAAFRQIVRAYIEQHKPTPATFKLPQSFLEVESPEQFVYLQNWQKTLYDGGYLGFDTPEQYGGRGIDPERNRVVHEELTRARAPFLINFIGLYWAGPTILTYGNEAQKRRLLPPLLRGDEIWCQGFSEPAAGSDLASLQTRAVRTESGWEVTGHKVWTTLAHFAKWMILLCRTNPEVNKYLGLSYFLFPMDTAGVTVQPLIKMTGEGGFNQVLFDHSPARADALLGEEGQGWQIAMTTLLFERGAVARASRSHASGYIAQIERLVQLARQTVRNGRPVSDDAVFRDRVVALWTEAHALAHGAARAGVDRLCSERPLALPLMTKLTSSEFNQRLTELATEMLGPDAALYVGDDHAPFHGEWTRAYMNSFGFTIGGGTSEIQRNILGERVLGLPKSK